MFQPRSSWLRVVVLSCVVAFLAGAPTRGSEPNAADAGAGRMPVEKMLPELHLLEPPWRSGRVYRESLIFVQDAAGGEALGKLLFPAEEILAVHRADGRAMFQAGRDFTLAADKRGLVLTAVSPILRLAAADLFPPKDCAAQHSPQDGRSLAPRAVRQRTLVSRSASGNHVQTCSGSLARGARLCRGQTRQDACSTARGTRS